jgi:rubrerythrin
LSRRVNSLIDNHSGGINMGTQEHYVCLGCGLIVEGGEPPEICPICGASQRAFYPRQYMPEVEITLPSDKKVPAAPTQGEKHWVCLGCGHIDNGEMPPEQCPICKAPQEMFKPRHLITK